jgi:hypothetical protein
MDHGEVHNTDERWMGLYWGRCLEADYDVSGVATLGFADTILIG